MTHDIISCRQKASAKDLEKGPRHQNLAPEKGATCKIEDSKILELRERAIARLWAVVRLRRAIRYLRLAGFVVVQRSTDGFKLIERHLCPPIYSKRTYRRLINSAKPLELERLGSSRLGEKSYFQDFHDTKSRVNPD